VCERRARRADRAAALLTAAVLAASGCGGGDGTTYAVDVRCVDQRGTTLRPAADLPPRAAIRRAEAIAAREARRRGSALARVLNGSAYRVGAGATMTFPASAASGGGAEQFGATAELVLQTPHAAGPVVVPAFAIPVAGRGDADRAAPTGYLRFPGTLRAAVLRDVLVSVDLRTGVVIAIAPGRRSASGGVEPLPGDCRLVRERAED
jgi:hypothetical protein